MSSYALSPLGLQELLDAVLAASVDALDTIPDFAPGFEGAPERRLTTAGQPVFDCCPMLSVNANPIREAPMEPLGMGAGTRHRLGYRKNYVGVQVWIARCLPSGPNPSSADLESASAQTNADGWALWNYLWNITRQGSADPLVTLCETIFFDGMTPILPSGGCAGWTLNLRIELAGYGDGADPGGTP